MKKSFRTTYACILAAVMGHMLSAAEPSGFTIRGIIYHKTDKGVEPVDMAVVSVPEFTIGGSTNLQGEYLLQNVPSGKVRLTVHHWAMCRSTRRSASQPTEHSTSS